ncbi:acetyl/propionyl/methylcrotonyl-CoA carboxylase subunit alpha [Roseovarius sp.]|uniref:acetyl-CoA carboxylase biotin carboxylase subunit n=1 Tax=Roseovarius sp. TaxID=1486281 RepID=UPI0026099DC6|nr:acetyl/propionyl/methylcrotonyl-CoA carboxylase subunit alpha [Roseovarius sp.]
MISTLLIANRGEIACRIAASARKLGIRTIAVYSQADRDAAHVAACDVAVPIGGPAPADSYLRGDAIIAAALDQGADAIHPGYGFLSENPDFVEAVEAAGLTFVGPSAKAIRAMGLKDAAKALMEKAGVPVVPGYHGADQDPAVLAKAAEDIGYPVLIKAVAGGGGKGMRQVDAPGDFASALASAMAEARNAFGNDAVLIEKFVTRPRHIELQVFGDGARAVHLFERDCSLQRRHQKVIEEAPAPGMTQEMRTAMGDAAVRAAEAIGYSGAGTVEFIVDASEGLQPDRFWFMEMNTRLQVEHPVTEMVTGVDLVEWQLRVAGGEPLPPEASNLTLQGHAFEARLYAEDVPAGFLPATGKLALLEFSADARIDSGVRTGDTISPWYDPMIAKVTVHGPTREAALRKLGRALEQTKVAGTVTNLSFLRALTRHGDFMAGDVDTGLIGRDLAALAAEPVACTRTRALAALGVAGLDGDMQPSGFTLWEPLRQSFAMHYRGEDLAAHVTTLGSGHYKVEVDGAEHQLHRRAGGWTIDGENVTASLHRSGGRVTVFFGNAYEFTAIDPLDRQSSLAGSGAVLSPMPGLVREVLVSAGQQVAAGDKLAILEAMKMEHALKADRDGRIDQVLAKAGDQVEAGAVLITFEDPPE